MNALRHESIRAERERLAHERSFRFAGFARRLDHCETLAEIDQVIDEMYPGERAAYRRRSEIRRRVLGALIYLALFAFLVAS